MQVIHMGKLLEKVVRKKGFNISELARKLGVNRRTIYNWFGEENINRETMQRIADTIEHDFSNDYKDSNDNPALSTQDPLIKDDEYWKDKYIDLLERYAELLNRQID